MLPRRNLIGLAASLPALAARAEEGLRLHVVRVEERTGRFTGTPDLLLVLDRTSRAAFARWTAKRVGRSVRLLIDGEVLVEARLAEPITGGALLLTSTAGQRRGAIETVLSHAKGVVTAIVVPPGEHAG